MRKGLCVPVRGLSLSVALAAAVVAAAGCGREENVIKVGFAGPLTQGQASLGKSMHHGALLAFEQAAAAGEIIPGFTIELVAMDDQASPTQSVSIAKKFVSDHDVVAVIGHLNSSCSMPASAIYHQAGMLQISPASSNPEISRQGFKTFYRTAATDDLQGPGAAIFAVRELGAKRIFILDDRTTYGLGFSKLFEEKARELGAEIIGHEGLAASDKDFVPLLTKIKPLAPDLLFFAGMYPEGALLLKQRADVGLGGRFMGGDGLFDPALIDLATPEAAEGAHVSTITADVRQIPTAQEFVKAYEARFGPIGAYSAYAYEAANVVLWAIRRAGKPDRAAVLAAMRELKDFPGIFGTQNFDERGDSTQKKIGIFTVKDGKFEFVRTAELD